MICLNKAWISAWISLSVFSAWVAVSGAEFSLSPEPLPRFFLPSSLKMLTYCRVSNGMIQHMTAWTHIELPSLHMLAGLLACHDDDKFGDL